jgi:hypothetical protein
MCNSYLMYHMKRRGSDSSIKLKVCRHSKITEVSGSSPELDFPIHITLRGRVSQRNEHEETCGPWKGCLTNQQNGSRRVHDVFTRYLRNLQLDVGSEIMDALHQDTLSCSASSSSSGLFAKPFPSLSLLDTLLSRQLMLGVFAIPASLAANEEPSQ